MSRIQLEEDFALSPAIALACIAERLGYAVRHRDAQRAWRESETSSLEALEKAQALVPELTHASNHSNGAVGHVENPPLPDTTQEPWFERWRFAASRLNFRVGLSPLTGDHELIPQLEETGGIFLLAPEGEEPDKVFVVTGVRGNKAWLVAQNGSLRTCPVQALAETLGSSGVETGYRLILCHGGPSLASAYSTPLDGGHAIVQQPTGHHDDAQEHGHGHSMSPLTRLYWLLRPDRWDIAVAAVYSLVVAFLSLATPLAAEQLVNVVGFGSVGQPLVVISLLLFAGLMFATLLKTLQAVVAEIIQQRLFVRVVADLAWRLPRVRHQEFDTQHGPELLNRFFDVMTVQKTAALLVLEGVAVSIQFLVGMLVLAFYHPWFLGLDVLLTATFCLAVWMLGRGGIRSAIQESLAKYAVAGWLEQIAQYSVTFKGLGGHQLAAAKADEFALNYVEARQRHFGVLLRQFVFMASMQAVAGSLLLGFGGWLVIQGRLTLGQLVAAELILAIMIGGLAKLGKFTESFYDLMAAVDKLGHLFDLSTEIEWGEVMVAKRPITLEFRNVSASIQGLGGFVNASIKFGPGGIYVVSGPSGSGKSLMLDLAYGLREPHSGRVLVDGISIRELSVESMRQHCSLLRNLEIFQGTVLENVSLSRSHVSSKVVRELLDRLNLSDDISSLPNGLDEVLRPEGSPLSSNQARRLQLARCLAGHPRLLLLDGFLDSFPPRVLELVFRELQRISHECTVVIVSNREDVQRLADFHVHWPDAPQTLSPLLGAH